MGEPDGIGEDWRDAEGRSVPAGRERSRWRGAPALHPLVRGGRLHRPGRPDRQHLCAPPGQGCEPPARDDRQPSRHPADRRQVRRGIRGHGRLELVRTLNDLGYESETPIEIVAWTNEEGSRFSPAMVGSGVFAGVFDLAEGLARPDNFTGVTLGAELERIGFAGPEPVGGRPVAAYFEAHIEQGPILEAAEKPIGVVTGAQGQRWYDEITVTGQEAHAGPTPMPRRRDALVSAARIIDAVNRIGHAHAPYACATVGFVQVSPNSRNTIPGRVFFTVDFRHPQDAVLTAMDQELREACEAAAAPSGLEVEVKDFWYFPPTPFDSELVVAVRGAAVAQGYPHQDIVSGAGHDAVYMARVAPTAMIFVPCVDGISHNEIEDAKPEDLTAGCNVLLNAVLERANAA